MRKNARQRLQLKKTNNAGQYFHSKYNGSSLIDNGYQSQATLSIILSVWIYSD